MAGKSRWQCIKDCTWDKKYWVALKSVYEGTKTPPAQFFKLLGPVEENTDTGGEGGRSCGLSEARVREIAREEMPAPCDCPGLATETEFDEMLRVVGLL